MVFLKLFKIRMSRISVRQKTGQIWLKIFFFKLNFAELVELAFCNSAKVIKNPDIFGAFIYGKLLQDLCSSMILIW